MKSTVGAIAENIHQISVRLQQALQVQATELEGIERHVHVAVAVSPCRGRLVRSVWKRARPHGRTCECVKSTLRVSTTRAKALLARFGA